MNFIIDTNIWKIISFINDKERDGNKRAQAHVCLHFLTTFYYRCKDHIVLDIENDIINEYSIHITRRNLAYGFYKDLIFRNKSTRVSRSGLNLREKLKGISFDPDDIKFLELSAKLSGNNTIIISLDSDFMDLREILKNDPNLRSQLRNPIIMNPEEVLQAYYTKQ